MSGNSHIRLFLKLAVVVAAVAFVSGAYAQVKPTPSYRVIDGKLKEVVTVQGKDSAEVVITEVTEIKETVEPEIEKVRKVHDSIRYSKIFRDTIPMSRMTAISLVAPGFSQLYNKQAWKIPVLYGVTGGLAYLGFSQNSKYKGLRKQYDALIKAGVSDQNELDAVQAPMIRHNTARTAFLVGAVASYVYFLADGVLNYRSAEPNRIKIATTLSTICPGAGQFYNKSFWKVPIVLGGFATLGYIVDFNTRGYKRCQLAYDLLTDDDPSNDKNVDINLPAESIRQLKNNYRRNRDLSIIITAGFYLLNIIDAHVDAHMKDFDISDDMAVNFYPSVERLYTSKGTTNSLGMTMSINF